MEQVKEEVHYIFTSQKKQSQNQAQDSSKLIWEVDFFQITQEGQEQLQKVAGSISM